MLVVAGMAEMVKSLQLLWMAIMNMKRKRLLLNVAVAHGASIWYIGWAVALTLTSGFPLPISPTPPMFWRLGLQILNTDSGCFCCRMCGILGGESCKKLQGKTRRKGSAVELQQCQRRCLW